MNEKIRVLGVWVPRDTPLSRLLWRLYTSTPERFPRLRNWLYGLYDRASRPEHARKYGF